LSDSGNACITPPRAPECKEAAPSDFTPGVDTGRRALPSDSARFVRKNFPLAGGLVSGFDASAMDVVLVDLVVRPVRKNGAVGKLPSFCSHT
jgi:hypothetical protein